MKEAAKFNMICITSDNERHLFLRPSFHFTILVDTSILPI